MFSAFAVLIVAAFSCQTMAFPQNNRELFPVDGFFFDGPADRTLTDNVDPPARTDAPPTTTTTTTTTATPTETPRDYFRCLDTCPTTPEYNPVCGSDQTIYNNPGSLNCATFCGKTVTMLYYGQCRNGTARG